MRSPGRASHELWLRKSVSKNWNAVLLQIAVRSSIPESHEHAVLVDDMMKKKT
jgi:hypothetical protein